MPHVHEFPAGVVQVVVRVVVDQAVVAGSVDAAELRASGRDGRPRRCGCKHHVEDHLDARFGSDGRIALNSGRT